MWQYMVVLLIWAITNKILLKKKKLLISHFQWIQNENKTHLTLPWRRSLSYRNESNDLQIKSVEWFLYDRDLYHKRVKGILRRNTEHFLKKPKFRKIYEFLKWNNWKIQFFLFRTVCIFGFCKNMNPRLYILFLFDKSMT